MITVCVCPKNKITATVVPKEPIRAMVRDVTVNLEGDIYDGEYDVTPTFAQQTLPTSGKTLRENVTVQAIYVGRTDNASGGKTVYIGGIFDGE